MTCLLYTRPEEYHKVRAFSDWESSGFMVSFVLASLMGSILTYSTFLCTACNSALTTTVVGCLKNVLTTYLGMIFMNDYIFSWSNFVGLNISIVGSLLYSYAEFVKREEKVPVSCDPWSASFLGQLYLRDSSGMLVAASETSSVVRVSSRARASIGVLRQDKWQPLRAAMEGSMRSSIDS
jgi:hypothetical protein